MTASACTAEILVWRGQCPACGERVISDRQRACPECGLDEPKQLAITPLPQASAWVDRGSAARSSVGLAASGATGMLAVAAGGPAAAVALSLGVFLMSAISLLIIGVATRSYHRRRARFEQRMLRRHATALAPRSRAIVEARLALEAQIATLVELTGRIDSAIGSRADDDAGRRRLAIIRGTIDAAIQARTMTMGQLEAAAAEIAVARWLCKLAMLTDELRSVDEVPPRLMEASELEHAARRTMRGLTSITDPARRRQLEERWAKALDTLAEVRRVLRAEEERLLAIMVRDAVRCVRPIAALGLVPPPLELPAALELPGGPGSLDLLANRITAVRDEVQRCLDEEHRLRAELDAIVEVDRLLPSAA